MGTAESTIVERYPLAVVDQSSVVLELSDAQLQALANAFERLFQETPAREQVLRSLLA